MSTNQRRELVFEFIKSRIARDGYPPTIREIMEGTGITTTSVVSYHLNALAREGRIVREPQKSRTIRVIAS